VPPKRNTKLLDGELSNSLSSPSWEDWRLLDPRTGNMVALHRYWSGILWYWIPC
jgi:hypothetical protein